ncbi:MULTISPECIES: lytic murein transglycosylase [unclassified Chelatococcus]|uniref:lytic murein transglycosylase n=1 Tax=unclassified Chelatococcus TaxID=2638111 RepID=UPI001BCBB5E4|nr:MULTISPECIES: lytic murein transglycosylase [unclassified Chelatococcus]MBS7697891.1 lytic murein transglycosylase [Chelatococcus sp. YT9]MBX3558532.1 lytic murein transglycosylase [Chelatococcus sp.]
MRHSVFAFIALALLQGVLPQVAVAQDFGAFLREIRGEASAAGVTTATFDAETAGLTPDLGLPNLDLPGRRGPSNSGQSEFTLTPAQYLAPKALSAQAARGRQYLARHRQALAAIERRYGVPGSVVLAIWGRETAFGAAKVPYDAVRVLATQAFVGRRKAEFRQEFLLALKMLQDGVVTRPALRSSWAGAIGLTQMLPSQYYKYGVDFDGSGRVDIWTSEADALASIANHLSGEGWVRGLDWALEVKPAPGFTCGHADPERAMTVAEWLSRGFAVIGGKTPSATDRSAQASLFMPAGAYGPAFLITRNYYALKAYNFSDLYVLYVGHLADLIDGGRPFATPWQGMKQASTAGIATIQRELARHGHYGESIDGRAGMRTRLAIGLYQEARGLPVDCWPGETVLKALEAAR